MLNGVGKGNDFFFEDLQEVAQGEFAENEVRKDFTPSERVAISEALKPIEEAKAKERQEIGVNQYTEPGGKFPPGSAGKTRDKVGKAVGVSGKTLEKAEVVVRAAKDKPEQFAKFQDNMDQTGKVDSAFRQVRAIQKFEALADTPPLETVERFGLGVACFLAPLRVSKEFAD